MRPLTSAGAGFVLLLVDFRVYGVDVTVDIAGWALIAWGMWRLAGPKAAAPAAAGGAFSIAEIHLPYHHRLVEAYTGRSDGTASTAQVEVLQYDRVSGVPLVAMALAAVCAAVVMVTLVRLLRERAIHDPGDPVVRTMFISAGATVLLWVAPRLAGMIAGGLDDGFDPVWNDPVWRIELAGILAGLTFAATLLISRREPWALPPGPRRTGNWSRVSGGG